MKKPSTKTTKKLSLIQKIGLLIAVLLVVLLAWNWYVHYTDKQKFMTLRQDMLELQSEFNKIDSGWQYSEWCHAKGEKFKENESSSCGMSLANYGAENINRYTSLIEKYFRVADNLPDQTIKDTVNINGRVLKYLTNDSISCDSGETIINNKSSISLSCSGSALDFYFPKTQ